MNSIKALRERANLTQIKLAEKLKVKQASVSRWENGDSFPSADKLPELAKILNCSVDDLYSSEIA